MSGFNITQKELKMSVNCDITVKAKKKNIKNFLKRFDYVIDIEAEDSDEFKRIVKRRDRVSEPKYLCAIVDGRNCDSLRRNFNKLNLCSEDEESVFELSCTCLNTAYSSLTKFQNVFLLFKDRTILQVACKEDGVDVEITAWDNMHIGFEEHITCKQDGSVTAQERSLAVLACKECGQRYFSFADDHISYATCHDCQKREMTVLRKLGEWFDVTI
jgi:hypothetical protein